MDCVVLGVRKGVLVWWREGMELRRVRLLNTEALAWHIVARHI